MTCARSSSRSLASRLRRARQHGCHGLRQRVSVEAILQQIVLRAALDGQPGDVLVAQAAQDQDRNVRRGAEEQVERLDSLAIGQEEVDHGRRDVFAPLTEEPFYAVAASTHPLDVDGSVSRVDEQLLNGARNCGIVQYKKYGPRHSVLRHAQRWSLKILHRTLELSVRYRTCQIPAAGEGRSVGGPPNRSARARGSYCQIGTACSARRTGESPCQSRRRPPRRTI